MKKFIPITIALLLSTTGLFAQNGLKTGEQAPTFTAKDNHGKIVDLKTLLRTHKAVVLLFYRGQWCPYCSKQIKQLQDSLKLLTNKGAYVLAVTPEAEESIKTTVEKTNASFSIMHDTGYKIMKAYDVNYVMPEAMFNGYKSRGVDMEKVNGNSDHMLPVPATYVIDKTGKLIYVHFDKNIAKRPSIKTLLSVL